MNLKHYRYAGLLALVTSLFAMDVTTRVAVAGCPPSERVAMPSCASHDWGFKLVDGFWYKIKNDCADDIRVKVDIKGTWDEELTVPAGLSRNKTRVLGSISTIKCCTDAPGTHCYADTNPEQEPANRDLHPRYYFRVEIGDGLRGYGTDPNDPPWTAKLACHSHDLNRWIDEAIDPWEKVWCDARYNAYISVNFKETGTTTKETIDPPYNNPCDSGGPLYEITADEGLTFGADLGHERVGCG